MKSCFCQHCVAPFPQIDILTQTSRNYFGISHMSWFHELPFTENVLSKHFLPLKLNSCSDCFVLDIPIGNIAFLYSPLTLMLSPCHSAGCYCCTCILVSIIASSYLEAYWPFCHANSLDIQYTQTLNEDWDWGLKTHAERTNS